MRTFALSLIFCAAALPAAAQLQLAIVDGGAERPAGSLVNVGSAAPGDSIDTRFRVRNPGAAATALSTLTLGGAGFSFTDRPGIPLQINAGEAAEFAVRFRATDPGQFSAILTVNATVVVLRASVAPGPVISVVRGEAREPVAGGGTIDFGSLESGATAQLSILIENRGSQRLTLAALTVSGPAFSAPSVPASPVVLEARTSLTFVVIYSAGRPGADSGTLVVDSRSVNLRGVSTEPPLPAITLSFSPEAPRSAQQVRTAIRLASGARAAVTGVLRLAFRASVTGVADDPAAVFVPSGAREIAFSIAAGARDAVFGADPSAIFQTGTTAGAFTISLEAGSVRQQAVLTIPAAATGFDTVRATRNGANLEVEVRAFDNTRSAGALSFTFYDRSGNVISGTPIRVDAATALRAYFDAGSPGGAFLLRAVFPVTGDAAQVGGVEVEITNSVGASRSARSNFP